MDRLEIIIHYVHDIHINYNIRCNIYSIHITHCVVHTTHYTVHITQYTLYSIQSISYTLSIQYTLNTIFTHKAYM